MVSPQAKNNKKIIEGTVSDLPTKKVYVANLGKIWARLAVLSGRKFANGIYE